jgi:hypothetical protein
MGGYVFFQYAMSFFYIVTGILGVSMHWGAVASYFALLTGPYGILFVVVTSILTFGSADPNDVVKFIMTLYLIRSKKASDLQSQKTANMGINLVSDCPYCNNGFYWDYNGGKFSIPCNACNGTGHK